jgi:hypothetical protein
MRRRTKSRRKIARFTNEFIAEFGLPYCKKMMLRYEKGWIGIPETLRIGVAGDDFAYNQYSAIVVLRKAPRLIAPKIRRKNKLNKKKLKKLRDEKTDC